jgi:RND family efflux transporter MFP subunit
MKKYTKILLFAGGIIAAAVVLYFSAFQKSQKGIGEMQMVSQQASTEKEILYYTCGMHPSVRVSPQDYEKGNTNCPICNMALVPVYREGREEMTMEEGQHEEHDVIEALVTLSPRARALASVKTEEVQYLSLFKEISTVGEMDYDERRVAYVAAWIPGRIDKLFVDFTGLKVEKGDPLVWIYSPELLTTQEEYLLALETLDRVKPSQNQETIREAQSLVEASRKRLLLWGINEKQIEELEQSREASTHMTIYTPLGGTVIHKNAYEGKYVKEGENLYQIADLSNLWVKADIYEYEMAWVKKGQEVDITTPAFPDQKFEGTVSFIDPYLNPKTRSVKVRMDVPNPRSILKPGMYVDVSLRSQIHKGIRASDKELYTCPMHPEVVAEKPGDCPICGMYLVKRSVPAGSILAVPNTAVLDTGVRKLVYVEKEKGRYEAIEVEVGAEAVAFFEGTKQTYYAIKAGLYEGMRVVTQANFLIDSQSQITGQAQAVYGGALEKGEEEKPPPSKHIH